MRECYADQIDDYPHQFLNEQTFNYPGWKDDVKECEKNLLNGWNYLARKKLQSIKNKQCLHDGNCSDPNILRLESGEFYYDGFEDDHQVAMDLFRDGQDLSPEMVVFEVKQRRQRRRSHDGDGDDDVHLDCLHPILQEMKNERYNYDGWEEDQQQVIETLSDITCWYCSSTREVSAQLKLDRMRKRQKTQHDDENAKSDDPILKILNSDHFTYPTFREDKRLIIQEHKDGFYVQKFVQFVQVRQKLHDGIYSHPLLESLATCDFTYKRWKDDAKELNDLLFCTPVCSGINLFTPEEKATRKFKSMQVKQRIHMNTDPVIQLLQSGRFTYDDFEDNKSEVMKMYLDGYSVSEDIKQMKFKQRIHNGERTHPILSSLDKALYNSKLNSECRNKETDRKDATNTTRTKESESGNQCIICLEQSKTMAFVPCGHVILCTQCAKSPNFSGDDVKCPVCREKSSMLIKVYL